MKHHMLTTVDNPYNPFTQFDEWFAFDTQNGYNSLDYLARIANTSPDLSDYDYDLEIETAIQEIISMNVLGIYRRVEEPNES